MAKQQQKTSAAKPITASHVSVQVLSNVESAVERMLHDFKGKTPAESAKACVGAALDAAAAQQGTFLATCIFLTYFEQRAQMDQFIEAYRKEAEEHTKRGTDGEKLIAARIGQYTNRMGRVVRAIWGVPNNAQFKPIGADAVRKLLMGKGTVNEKLDALPSTRQPGASGSNSVEQPVQLKRLATLATQVPSRENLARALGAVKSEGMSDATYTEIVETKLTTAVKMTPNEEMGLLVNSVCDKLYNSGIEEWKDFSVSVRDGWKAVHTAHVKTKAPASSKKPATASK